MTHLDEKRKSYDFLSALGAAFADEDGVADGSTLAVESAFAEEAAAGADVVESAFVSLFSAEVSVEFSLDAALVLDADFALSFSARKSVT